MAENTPGEEARRVSVADLRAASLHFEGSLDAAARAALAKRFDIPEVTSLSYDLTTRPWRTGVRVTGSIAGGVIQECVVTLDPVPGEIDEDVDRGFLPMETLYSEDKPGSEHEVVADSELGDIPEPLTDPLDMADIVAETLGVALDPYPRSADAQEAVFSSIPPGAEPIVEAEIKPFAGLAALRAKMDESGSDG